jgi:hypothetical protein
MVKPTKFLRIICSLSFIHSIYGIITGLTTALAPPEVDSEYLDKIFAQLGEVELPIKGLKGDIEDFYLNLLLDMGNYGASEFLFFSIQLIAVIMMYRLKRFGFTLYILAQIGLAAAPVIFGGFNTFGKISLSAAVVWNLIWVLLYASQRKQMVR